VDTRDMRGGDKVWGWIKKGVPVRLEIGPRDIANDSVFLGRRDRTPKDKKGISRNEFVQTLPSLLDEIQSSLLQRAMDFRTSRTRELTSRDAFVDYFGSMNQESSETGFGVGFWAGNPDLEESIKKDFKVTVRCLPMEGREDKGPCIFTGSPEGRRAVFAFAY
ncbi:MAG: His/Gly/Thr/Pro-type tRNA ligase C-terminal domain-containing protein, partial [Opitutales bacterium]|nr:His/Gly/Thr/Pro-type tRNA ligase C-terminal domain-containing protein [Opitutales bacterium]